MENNYEFIDEKTMIVDIHGFRSEDAKYYLERLLAHINTAKFDEIIVIHGYNNGDKLQTLVRKELRSKKIERRLTFWNPGRTSLILKH